MPLVAREDCCRSKRERKDRTGAVAIPSEVKDNEFRVAITPAGVGELVGRGHEVFVQSSTIEVNDIYGAEQSIRQLGDLGSVPRFIIPD